MLRQERRISEKADMRALSIRQPYAELILRGIQPIEFRSRPARSQACQQRIIFSVGSDEEPHDHITVAEADGAVIVVDADGPDVLMRGSFLNSNPRLLGSVLKSW